MRIGIDARELCGHATGVGRYLRGLLDEWSGSERARRHEFVLYSPEPLGVSLDARRFPTHIVAGSSGTWWEQVSLPKIAARDHLDVFFSPAYTAPLLPSTPTVVAIHDLSFAAHPEWFTMREGMRRRWLTRRAARRARAVLTISEFSRREILERLGVADARVHVVPPGITPPARSAAPGGGMGAPNILYVGSIFNRRHVPDLIRAFGAIARAHPDASLDIVGDDRTFPHEDLPRTIEIEAPGGRARWHRYVDRRTVEARSTDPPAPSRSSRNTRASDSRRSRRSRPAFRRWSPTRPWRARAAATPRSTSRSVTWPPRRARSSGCCSTTRPGARSWPRRLAPLRDIAGRLPPVRHCR